MKNIKTVLFLIVFGCSISVYTQSIGSLVIQSDLFNFDAKDYALGFKNIDFSKNKGLFSSYNKTTQLNDIYITNNDAYSYSTSNLSFDNTLRAYKVDSYNPYGVSNIGSALILGIIGSFLNVSPTYIDPFKY